MTKANILIVEDEAIIASVIAAALKKFEYHVIDILNTGEAAAAVALEKKPDLILMDIRLLGAMDGISAAEQIQQHLDIPIIYLTAYADEPTLERAKKTKPYGYIPKPFQEIELKTTIEMALYKHGFELQLKESEAKFRSLFENSLDVIYVADRAGILVEMNPAGVNLFGYVREELIGKKPRHLYADPRQRDELLASIWEHRSVTNYPVKLKKKNGEAILGQITANVIADASGKISGFQGILRDVTKEKKLEEQMILAAKMDSLGHLASGIAHDFNNYLTIINGYSEMLLYENENNKNSEHLGIILQAGKSASKLVAKILGFSRRQAAAPAVIDVNSTMKDLERMVRRLLGEGINLQLDLHSDPGRVLIDPTQIEQVLINLVLNARDAMPGGGSLTLASAPQSVDEDLAATHPGLAMGDYAAIRVQDSGQGMEPQVLARIFEPFFTTKPKGEGTGLGLASVFGIVAQNNGAVWAESKAGRGSTFHILFPRVAESIAPLPAPVPERRFAGRTALLVEDEPGIRELMREILDSLGLQVHAAADGKQALKTAKTLQRLDLLFCDVVLPGISGVEVADGVRKLHPGTKVIFTSGHGESYLKRFGLVLPQAHFVEKPSSRAMIVEKISEVLGGEAGG